MIKVKNNTICRRLSDVLNQLYSQRDQKIDQITKLQEKVGRSEGILNTAENTLSSIQDAIDNIGDDALSFGVSVATRDLPGAVRDGVATAVGLANEEARQRNEVAEARNNLSNDKWLLQAAQQDLFDIEAQIRDTVQKQRANDCI